MFRSCLSGALIVSLLFVGMRLPVRAQSNLTSVASVAEKLKPGGKSDAAAATDVELKEARAAAKVKYNIAKLGTGPQARVEVKLRDNRKVKGYISETSESGFVVVNAKTNNATPVPYSQVKKVQGNNLSTGARIAITVGFFVLVIVMGILWFNKPARQQ